MHNYVKRASFTNDQNLNDMHNANVLSLSTRIIKFCNFDTKSYYHSHNSWVPDPNIQSPDDSSDSDVEDDCNSEDDS